MYNRINIKKWSLIIIIKPNEVLLLTDFCQDPPSRSINVYSEASEFNAGPSQYLQFNGNVTGDVAAGNAHKR
jgi:hypothetical protein